jgi:Ca-activated chloride channel family protein
MVAYRSKDSDRGTFMLTVTPGDDLADISGGRDWVFVLDYSGSMQGKYHSLVEGVRKGLARLNPDDRFKVVLFNNRSWELTRGYRTVSAENIQEIVQQLESIQPDGGTNLYAGLDRGIRGLDADRPSAVLLVTDGVANVGVTEKKDFLELLERHDVRLFSFVMGNSANRPLLEGMTRVSNGFAMNISNSDDIVGRIVQATAKLSHEAYRDIRVQVRGVKVRELTPARIGSLYRGQQLVLMGHYWGDGAAEVEITGRVSAESRTYRASFEFPGANGLNPELERLWAFATVENLQDRIDYLGGDADARQAIIDIALEYGLVTDYTSLVVMREEAYAQHGIDRDNAARVARERAAREQRSNSGIRSHTVDAQQPAFGGTRAYPQDGAGALGPWSVLLLLLLLAGSGASRSRKSTA